MNTAASAKPETRWQKMRNFASAHKPLTIVSCIVVVFIAAAVVGRGGSASATTYAFGRVTRGDLAVTVSGSGQVSTLSQVSIKPQTVGQAQTLGQIVSVNVKNGDFVKKGQVIAVLDGQNALQTLNQAKASVESAQASYNKLVNGPTASELQSFQNNVQSDETALVNDAQNAIILLESTYASIANSVFINTDPFYENVTGVNPALDVSGVNFTNQTLQHAVESERGALGAALSAWDAEVNTAASSTQDAASSTEILLSDSLSYLNQIRQYFDDMTSLFSLYAVADGSSGASTLSLDKSAATAALSGVNSSISSITSSLQSYQNAVTKLANDQQSLAFETAPANPDDVTVSKSQLDNATANLANAETNYASRIITAPFDGQIGGLNAQIGQQVSSSDSLGTLITAAQVVNVTLNEVDAAKVAGGDPVTVTFDAVPNLTIQGHVNYVDPLGTVSQGVVSYGVQVSLDEQSGAIKTGMTATANITVADHPGALMVPTSAVKTSGNTTYVLVADISTSSLRSMLGFGSSTRAFSSSTFQGFRNSSSTFASTSGGFPASSTRMRGTGGMNASIEFPAGSEPQVTEVPVTIGIANATETEILSGLSEGQLVVTRTLTGSAVSTAKSAATQATSRNFGGAGGAIRIGGGFGGGAVGAFTGGR